MAKSGHSSGRTLYSVPNEVAVQSCCIVINGLDETTLMTPLAQLPSSLYFSHGMQSAVNGPSRKNHIRSLGQTKIVLLDCAAPENMVTAVFPVAQ